MDRMTIAEAQTLCLKKNIPFYSYCLPGDKNLCFGAQLEGKVEVFQKEDYGSEGFIVVPFQESLQSPSLFIRGEIRFQHTTEETDLIRRLEVAESREEYYRIPEKSVAWEEYQDQVSTMISILRRKEIRKLVLARGLTVSVAGYTQAALWFEKLVRMYPEAFVFLVSVPGVMTWIGATPEILLEQTDKGCRTMALAGTRRAKSDGEWGQKEVEEQAIVTEYISSLLENTGNWQLEGPFSKRAGGVEHLCTTFTSRHCLSPEQVELVRKRLHPTPAVGGYPTAEALRLIAEVEGMDRRYYAGYLGPLFRDGTFHWFVNLRSMEIFPEAVRLYIGGGITALSDPRKEWEETELKSRTLLDMIEKKEMR